MPRYLVSVTLPESLAGALLNRADASEEAETPPIRVAHPLEEFLEECCEVKPWAFVRCGDLAAVYECWAKCEGHRLVERGEFHHWMRLRGFNLSRGRRVDGFQARTWEGIELLPEVTAMLRESRTAYDASAHGCDYSASEAADGIGWDIYQILNAIRRGELPAQFAGNRELQHERLIDRNALRLFVLNSLDEIDFAKVDKWWLTDLLKDGVRVDR